MRRLLILLLSLLASSAFATTQSYIRLNQVGYIAGANARAYLMTTGSGNGLPFTVKGTTSVQGTVGSQIGKNWGKYKIYPLDFTVQTPGQYTISIANGAINTTSPAFTIASANNLYASALANTLSFYQNQRDGANYIPSALRSAPGHLNDTKAKVYNTPQFVYTNNDYYISGNLIPITSNATINAEGGWWDAGDYLKFVQTHSYAVAIMLIGIRDFPNQMGAGSATSNFTPEAKFGLDWLQKMWDDKTKTLYYQVGIGSDFVNFPNILSDHDIWRLPQADDSSTGSAYQYIRNRPVFIAGVAGSQISPNLAGRLAADFALCFTVFKQTDPAYANQCLLSGEHIFDLANTSPSGSLLTTAPFDFYQETAWRDDLELGATELYLALRSGGLPSGLPHTDPNYYLPQAVNWANAYINGPNDQSDTLNLYDVSGLAHFELYRAITLSGNPSYAAMQPVLLNDMDQQMQTSLQQSQDPFGSPYGWNYSDTVSHVTGLSVMAAEYNYLSPSPAYALNSQRWADNALGANAWGVSFIVGNGTTFPQCMQHQVANLVGSTNGTPPILAGAVVEGPTNNPDSGSLDGMVACPPNGGDVYKQFNARGAAFKDNVEFYATTEPAIDLTASSMLMFSWQLAGSPAPLP